MNVPADESAFRADINGLRALAVMPVLLFHSGLSAFRGGFLGVDVFFVISGFLITRKIRQDLESGTFSFRGFYDRRARRILPGLLFVAMVSTALALIFMLPYSLKNFGESLTATMLSANNILLLLTSGYWSLAAEFKPLYHTWSLGVEEQYYLLAPLILYVCFRIVSNPVRATVALLGMLLAASLIATAVSDNREFTFLLLMSRAWELLVGALLALSAAPQQPRPWLAAFGLALVLASYVFPYVLGVNQALVVAVPVIGVALVIRYSHPGTFIGRLLAIRPLTFLGLISYSVYLWHQPILAFLRLGSSEAPTPLLQLLLSLLAIPLGYLSWRYIEQTFRDRKRVGATRFYAITGTAIAALVATGYLFHHTYGLEAWAPDFSYGVDPKIYVQQPFALRASTFHQDGRQRVLVVGNSYARDFINMLREAGYFEGREVIYWEGDCLHRSNGALEGLLSGASLVVFGENWGNQSAYEQDIRESIACYHELRSKTRARVLLLGTKNFGWNNDFVRLKQGDVTHIRVSPMPSTVEFNSRVRLAVGADFVDVLATVTDAGGKVPIFTPRGRFITYDTNHLTRAGAVFLGAQLFARYPILKPPSPGAGQG